MKVYHATTAEFARKILCEGFRDATGTYFTANERTGFWVTDVPMDPSGGVGNFDAWFEIEIDENMVAEYELIEDDKSYREWLLPAGVLNEFRTVRQISEEEWNTYFTSWW